MFKQDILTLLKELCPSFVNEKLNTTQPREPGIGTSKDAKSEDIDTSKDIVDRESGYLQSFWEEYESYPERSTLGSLWKCQRGIVLDEANPEARDQRLWSQWRDKKRHQFKAEEERAFKALLDLCDMKETMRFNQREHTSQLVNSKGICFALSLDWIRRKIWNSQLSAGRKKKEVWDKNGLDKRLRRIDALQSTKSNFRDPSKTLSAYDAKRTENRQKKRDESEFTGKSFSALIHGGQGKDFIRPEGIKNLTDNERNILVNFAAVRGSMEGTFGLLLELNGGKNGHAYAFFSRDREWSFFDPNFGEFLLASGPEKTIIPWFETYYTIGLVDMRVTGISRPS